jgi:cystathionine beta-lyase/cystathionine gamma-synthase
MMDPSSAGRENMTRSFNRLETKVIHAGEPEPLIGGAVTMPIFQSATFEYGGESRYDDIRYLRLNNTPNHLALHRKLAALENAETAVVTASGMAAITTTLLTFLSTGDHLLAERCLYGGTHDFITKTFPRLGISFDLIEGDNPDSWEEKVRPQTKAFYVETMTNPLLGIPKVKKLVAFAKKHHLLAIIDNTFASPVNFRPLEWGFDLSLHSCTKYLNGHSDMVGGAVIGREELIKPVIQQLNHLGGTLDPHACFLLHRGIKTLFLRVQYQNQSALRLAQFLESHPAIGKVNYPGLASHRGHARAQELFDGFGGMLSFEIKGGVEAADRFIALTTLPTLAPSLGGVETLITRPATTSHTGLSPEARKAAGISDSLIRLSVGIEATEDLLEDFDQALKGI